MCELSMEKSQWKDDQLRQRDEGRFKGCRERASRLSVSYLRLRFFWSIWLLPAFIPNYSHRALLGLHRLLFVLRILFFRSAGVWLRAGKSRRMGASHIRYIFLLIWL